MPVRPYYCSHGCPYLNTHTPAQQSRCPHCYDVDILLIPHFLPHLDTSLGRSYEFRVPEVHYPASHSLLIFWDSHTSLAQVRAAIGAGCPLGLRPKDYQLHLIQTFSLSTSARERPTKSSELSGFWTKVVIFVIYEFAGGRMFLSVSRSYLDIPSI